MYVISDGKFNDINPFGLSTKFTGSLTFSFNSFEAIQKDEVEVEKCTINQESLINRMLFIKEGLLGNKIYSLEMMFFHGNIY